MTTPLSGIDCCTYWDSLWSTCTPNFEVSKFTHYEDMKGNAKCRNWGGLGVKGHPRSPVLSLFDRMHMTSYPTLIETMRHSCTVFELKRVICLKSSIITYPTCIWRPIGGSNFTEIFGVRKLESLDCRVALLACDPTFCRFDTIPAFDGRTDRQTDGRTHDDG